MIDPKIAKLENDYRELESKLASGGLSSAELKEHAVKHSQMGPLMAKVRELLRVEKELEGLAALEADPDMRAMAAEERPALEKRKTELTGDIAIELLPKDPNDSKNCYLEIRAGAGGDEAGLFA